MMHDEFNEPTPGEIVMTDNEPAEAGFTPLGTSCAERVAAGALGVTYIREDFDAPLPDTDALFSG